MLKEGSSAETKDSFVKEVTLMSVLQHENILKLLALSIEEEPFCMVFEFMPNGDLNQYLRIHDPENTEEPDKGVCALLTIGAAWLDKVQLAGLWNPLSSNNRPQFHVAVSKSIINLYSWIVSLSVSYPFPSPFPIPCDSFTFYHA